MLSGSLFRLLRRPMHSGRASFKPCPPRPAHKVSWQRAAGNAQRKYIAFYIDAELDKACNWHVAQRSSARRH